MAAAESSAAPELSKRVLRRGLSLRAREMAALTVLTLCAVALTTIVHLHHSRLILWTATLREADLVARQVYSLSAHALSRPNAPEPWTAIRQSREVRALLDASVGYAPWLLDIVIVDQAGRAVVHSDVAREGQPVSPRPSLRGLVANGAFERLWTLHQSDRIYDVSLPFDLDRKPFGTIRVGTALPLVQGELDNALRYSVVLGVIALVAALAVGLALSSFTLRPMRKLAEDMERLRRGEFDVGSDAAPRDEFGKLAYQLQLLGRQIQTDRTRVQAERSRFQTAVDQLEDGLMLWSADGRVLFANRAVEAAVGRPAAELVGEPFDRALPEGHPLRPMVVAAIQDNETSRNVRVDIPGTGEPVQLLASVFPVADDRATCDGAILVLRDVRTVAVSARTFQSLIQYSAQLAALGQVTAEVTHDVKNPLHAMMLHVAFLRERLQAPPGDVRRSLETLEAEIRRADSLLTRFHESTRPSEVSLKPLDVNALLQEVATILGADWESRGVRFELDLDRSLPPVLGDEEMLRRAIMNVALNACQAMPEGGLVRLISEREDGALARITVSDTGVGVSPDDLDRIFGAYYTTKPGGTGIGLALVRRVVEMHNGAIDVVSTVGQGTSFIVRVPLHAGP